MYHHKRLPRRGFTLIELLVVIAIIAILAVVVVLTLNPAQLLAQSRDANRVSDTAILNTAIGLYQTDVAGKGSIGSSSVIYISLPDATISGNATSSCTSLGLLTLPTGYNYQCASLQGVRDTDATGWTPVNFQQISAGAPFGLLPVDPTNASSSHLYYTYSTNGTGYEVTAAMESSKYKLGGSNDVISGDGGPLVGVYEKGTKLGLVPLDYGDSSLLGLWSFDEGSGNLAFDGSGNKATGTWTGTPSGIGATYYTQGKVGSYAGYFNGSNDGVTTTFSSVGLTKFSVSLWVNGPSTTPVNPFVIASWGGSDVASPFQLFQGAGSLNIRIGDGAIVHSYTEPTMVFNSNWNFITLTYNGAQVINYVNGVVGVNQALAITPYQGSETLTIGNRMGSYMFSGSMDDIRIYNRALSAAEVQAIYSAGK